MGSFWVVTSGYDPEVGFISCSLSRVLSLIEKNTVGSMKGTPEREREAILQMPGPFECLVLVRWTGIWIEHMQGKRSDLSPQKTNLMDSAAKMA